MVEQVEFTEAPKPSRPEVRVDAIPVGQTFLGTIRINCGGGWNARFYNAVFLRVRGGVTTLERQPVGSTARFWSATKGPEKDSVDPVVSDYQPVNVSVVVEV